MSLGPVTARKHAECVWRVSRDGRYVGTVTLMPDGQYAAVYRYATVGHAGTLAGALTFYDDLEAPDD